MHNILSSDDSHAGVLQGGRKSGLFSPTASLPAFSSLTSNTEDRDLTLRPTCTLGPDAAITADSGSAAGTPQYTHHSVTHSLFYMSQQTSPGSGIVTFHKSSAVCFNAHLRMHSFF